MTITKNDYLYIRLLLLSFIVIALHQIIQRLLEVSIPFVDSYLDPFFSIPFLLSGFVLERRLLLNIRHFRLSFLEILISTVALSLIFEFAFPYFTSEFIYDLCDFLAYGLGGLLFYGMRFFD